MASFCFLLSLALLTISPSSSLVPIHTYTFDRVYNENTTQEEIYKSTARALVLTSLEGLEVSFVRPNSFGSKRSCSSLFDSQKAQSKYHVPPPPSLVSWLMSLFCDHFFRIQRLYFGVWTNRHRKNVHNGGKPWGGEGAVRLLHSISVLIWTCLLVIIWYHIKDIRLESIISDSFFYWCPIQVHNNNHRLIWEASFPGPYRRSLVSFICQRTLKPSWSRVFCFVRILWCWRL